MRRPFHHGNLRAVLLEQAEVMLRESGADGLSLRELARQAGVSHGAPRSHFIDRQALLDALAEQGFDRMAEQVGAALRSPGTIRDRIRLVGHAYVDFAVDNAALMELMFAAKSNAPDGPVNDAAVRLFTLLDSGLAGASGERADAGTRERFKLLFAAAMQGTAALITARRITPAHGKTLVDDATDALLTSELGVQVLSLR
ncbi:TetR/AcrR family transcriptional regulator [Actinoplanes sp. HUAS TT8]|uniref:TetR/AcrR family transcriptional regulator n=1 Tax=Actinoplanes sp. HUAS TT8 TaxID=3447453 RepID=UPI003F5256A3